MKAKNLIDVLNNQEWRAAYEAIEDVRGSLRGRECKILEEILQKQVDALEKASGFRVNTGRD